MAVANVESHGRRHVNPFVEQQLERASGTSPAARENAGNGVVAEDTFTPSESTQSTAQAAGIFQLSQAGIVTNAEPAQPGLTADPNAPPTQGATPVTTSNVNPENPAGTANANSTAVTTPATAATSTAPSSTLAGAASGAELAQEHALNTELAALGLSNYDILQIDRIAAALQNLSPSAYTDLVNQFERQAQEAQQLATPPPAAANAPAVAPLAGTNPNATAASVNPATAPETGNPAAPIPAQQNSIANIAPPAGHAAQVPAPQQNPDAASTNEQPSPGQNVAA